MCSVVAVQCVSDRSTNEERNNCQLAYPAVDARYVLSLAWLGFSRLSVFTAQQLLVSITIRSTSSLVLLE